MRQNTRQQRRSGFLLMELILALGVFGIAATGFAMALSKTADAADLAQRRMKVTRILDSALTEALSIPVLEEGSNTVVLDEENFEVDTVITLLDEIENQDGQFLQEMYRIEVVANWYENGAWQKETAETWRYARLYQQ